ARARATSTTWPSATEERAAFPSRGRGALGLPPLDEPEYPLGRLLDRELGHVDDRAPEPAVHRRGVLELLVDLDELGVGALREAHQPRPHLTDLGEPLGVDREADDLGAVDLEQAARRLDPAYDRDVRDLVSEEAEVHREGRLRRARHPDEDDLGLV